MAVVKCLYTEWVLVYIERPLSDVWDTVLCHKLTKSIGNQSVQIACRSDVLVGVVECDVSRCHR